MSENDGFTTGVLQDGADDVPLFFFSYARGDRDSFLDSFFEELSHEVAFSIGGDKGRVGFRELNDVRPGDDWRDEISQALQTGRVLLCLYTRRYFRRSYCGRELKVFLDRQTEVDYEDEEARHSKKIIGLARASNPLDWPMPGIPPIVRSIQFSAEGEEPQEALGKGVRHLVTVRQDQNLHYRGFLHDLAPLTVDIPPSLAQHFEAASREFVTEILELGLRQTLPGARGIRLRGSGSDSVRLRDRVAPPATI